MFNSRFYVVILFVVLISTGCVSQHVSRKTPEWYRLGTKMIYDVKFRGKSYDFIVTLKKLSPELQFDWIMMEPVNKTGSITISPYALENAYGQVNYLPEGELKLDSATCILLSKKAFAELIGENYIVMNPYAGLFKRKIFFQLPEKSQMKVKIDGKEEAVDVINVKEKVINEEEEAGLRKYTILNNSEAPLLFHVLLDTEDVFLGLEVKIREIKTK